LADEIAFEIGHFLTLQNSDLNVGSGHMT